MNQQQAQQILDAIVGQVFGYKNPFSFDQFAQKYAFDVRLPAKVNDTTTGQETWAQSINPTKFITMENAHKKQDDTDWLLPKEPLQSIQDILRAWDKVNYTATERHIESINMAQSDNVYNCENIFRSQDVHRSKNLVLCDSVLDSEYVAASQRSNHLAYVIRAEDSKETSNSFSVSWCAKITNSFFVHDCYDLFECMFCSHMSGKRFCIANMQFDEHEYMSLKKMVLEWILTS